MMSNNMGLSELMYNLNKGGEFRSLKLCFKAPNKLSDAATDELKVVMSEKSRILHNPKMFSYCVTLLIISQLQDLFSIFSFSVKIFVKIEIRI